MPGIAGTSGGLWTLPTFHGFACLARTERSIALGVEVAMKQSDHFRENADNCQRLAERAPDHPTYLRFKRMEDAWRSLANEQDWLDGETPPVAIAL
jgi:hypothetical protein